MEVEEFKITRASYPNLTTNNNTTWQVKFEIDIVNHVCDGIKSLITLNADSGIFVHCY